MKSLPKSRRSRNGSTPCPYDQISYKILKKCPSVVEALLNIFNHCLYRSSVPDSWKAAVVILLGKPAAKNDARNPSNFRPIALTPCIGKLFTAILKNRLLSYVASNGYLDTSIQKAFVSSMPGCFEHQVKLSSAIQEARLQQKNIAVCWLDLANAFGSVEHDLILLTLEHYHLDPAFINLVRAFYSGLSVVVKTATWVTDNIPFTIGIYQGDPMSVIIFNLVANLFVELITENYSHLGYHFTGSDLALSLLQYADDSCLVSNSIENCQVLCNVAEKWLQWACMKAKVPKCRVLAIRRGKVIDPQLTLNSLPIPPVGDDPIKFLGMPLSSTLDDNHHRQHVVCKLQALMAKVDRSYISRKQKLRLFSLAVCPRLAWDLMVIQLPISWVERQLDPLANSYLKKWAGLARCANPSILFLSQANGGLHLPALSTNFKKLQVSRMAQLLVSRDNCVRFVAGRLLQHENSTSGRAFLPASVVKGVMVENPGASKQKLKELSTLTVAVSDESSRLEKLQSLQVQGECFRLGVDTFDIWSVAVSSVTDIIMKFSLNALMDTLPHRHNLLKWGKAQTSACPLCSEKQTLIHVLNNCNIALRQRRFDQRHNEVLKIVSDFIRLHMPCGFCVTSDLPSEGYIRPDFLMSDLRPDIILWSTAAKTAYLLELTVCFDTNFSAAAERKTSKYFELVEAIGSTTAYRCYLYTLQVGSRGIVDQDSFNHIKSILHCTRKDFNRLLLSLSITAMTESFKIWSRRDCCD